jgi:ABC-type uncharacterized transport system substrate-binding protein
MTTNSVNKRNVFATVAIVMGAMILAPALSHARQKVLLIDSYNEGYLWSDGITSGVKNIISPAGYDLNIFRMDTKRKSSENDKLVAGREAKMLIERYNPDIVIAADDNAAQYVVVPYFKNKSLPIVFCGINWEAGIYGFPCSNVTGMIEVAPVNVLLTSLKSWAKGVRIGILGPNNETHLKEFVNIKRKYQIDMFNRSVLTFAAWKAAFVELQDSTDILILENYAGISGWDNNKAQQFVEEQTRIPTGTVHDFMAPFALICMAKSASEQGEWAAKTAIAILQGAKPSSIPVAENKRNLLYLNQRIAKKLNITFGKALVEKAYFINQ